MRSSPSRTVLASLISMTALSACSGGDAADAGVPATAAVVYDSNRAPAPVRVDLPPPPSTVAPTPAPVAEAPKPVLIAQLPMPAPAPALPGASKPAAPYPAKPITVAPVKPMPAPLKPITLAPKLPKPPATVPPVVAPPKVVAPKPAVPAPPISGNLAPLPPSLPLDTASGAVTDIHVSSTGASAQQAVPLTFAQVFAAGDVGPAQQLVGKLGDGTTLPLQVDVKARHPDGSLRHAVISASLPKLGAAQVQRIVLNKASAAAPGAAPSAAALLAAGFSAGVQLKVAGVLYKASPEAQLRSGKVTNWLSGPVSSEWLVTAPLVKDDGSEHPHLSARFAIRTYAGVKQARVDVTIENNWAFTEAPRNLTYNATIMVGGKSVYKKDQLTHFHHARWRKVFWWGQEPATHIAHNVGYLLATRALPHYDREVRVSNTRLDELATNFGSAGRDEPMAVGLAVTYMPATGGRDDIGLLPGWAATYLLTMDKRARDVTLGTADLAGSWSIHYRDKKTDKPVSLHDYPYMTTAGHKGDTFNPATKSYENFPPCAEKDACATNLSHDMAHQPNFAYLPYLLTGDHYYLEELQFWGMWNAFSGNPAYRQYISGLVKAEQVRGQAWGLRTLAESAYISPDNDPLKSAFDSIVKANLKWYNDQYTNNAEANKLGVLTHGYAIAYAGGTGLAPWMDDFFTSAVGHTAELGFRDALPLLKWKARFPIGRMIAPDVCWVTGAMYSMKVRDKLDGDIYPTVGKAWKASSNLALQQAACGSQAMATVLGLTPGEMTGYSKVPAGYPSNMQPALAYAADVGGSEGKAAWQRFMGRSIKPNYGNGPQFAIVPR